MDPAFWNYTIWYVLLGVLTSVELVFVLFKAKRRYLAVAFYLTILGIVLSYETVILIFMRAYVYYPMILKDPPIAFDAILAGNLFSQFSVSATALLVTILNLDYRWYLACGVIYGIIEEVYLALGVYSQNWYQTWMTVIGLPLYCLISKRIYLSIIQGMSPTIFYCYVFLGLYPLYVITIMWGFMVAGYLAFSKTVFSDPISSHYFLCLAVFAIPSAIANMFIYYAKPQLVRKIIVILLLYLFYYAGYRLNLILFKEGWFFWVCTITIVWMYCSVVTMDKLYAGAKIRRYSHDIGNRN